MRKVPGDNLMCKFGKHPFTDRALLCKALEGVTTVFHTATLHKPHIVTHTHDAFVQTNVAGTLALLEESVAAGPSCRLANASVD
jgi:nucleoside-diphosphate-sugar epimerase